MFILLSLARAEAPIQSVEPVGPDVWIHSTDHPIEGYGTIVSNGLLVDTVDGLVLVDTAWTDEKTVWLLDWAEKNVGEPVTDAIITHAHFDKMGGVRALHERGVKTWALPLTNRLAPANDLVPTTHTLSESQTFHQTLEIFFPGPGHSPDNLVVYVPAERLLHGGCLIRPGGASNLGNTGDADISAWDTSVRAVQKRFPKARHILPSHGDLGGKRLLKHTIELVEAHREK